jgi:hypothetical protein
MKNPFEQAKPVSKKLKLLFYGPSGSGKTYAALTFPRVAIVDAEGGSDLYAGRKGIAKFSVLRTKTVAELREAISFVRADSGKSFDTLVIDPITVFYDVLKESTARSAKNGEIGFREWAKINNTMKAVYNELTQLPVHVIVIGREAVEYEGTGMDLKKVGTKPDADKALVYMVDFVVAFRPDHSGIVMKSRGAEIGEGQKLSQVSWSAFEKVAKEFSKGATVEHVSEGQAIEAQALVDEFQDRERVEKFYSHWNNQSLSNSEITAALGVNRASEWRLGEAAAHQAVKKYIDEQLDDATAAAGK